MDTPDIDQIFTWFSLSNSFDYTAHHAKTIYEYTILPLSNSSSESVIDPYISSKQNIDKRVTCMLHHCLNNKDFIGLTQLLENRVVYIVVLSALTDQCQLCTDTMQIQA